jgi:hypothetical protein
VKRSGLAEFDRKLGAKFNLNTYIMPNKKQSARPAESGWLLEVGVFGINKTRTLLKEQGEGLLRVEQLLRNEHVPGIDKKSLPYLRITAPRWMEERYPLHLNVSWKQVLSGATKKKGRNLSEEEYYDLYQDWYDNGRPPGDFESGLFHQGLEGFELRQKGKGKGPKSRHRPSLSKWMMSAETFKLFRSGTLDNDTERPKKERIIAHSRALGDALKVISGELRALPARYPKAIERHLKGGARKSLREIIHYSIDVPNLWKKRLVLRSAQVKLVELERERGSLITEIEKLKNELEKMG